MNNENFLKKDILIYLLNKQTTLQKFSDFKAYIILAILAFVSWKMVPLISKIINFLNIKPDYISASYLFFVFIVVLCSLALIFSFIISLYFCLLSIYPKLHSPAKNTVFFYGYVSNKTPEEVKDEILNKDIDKCLVDLTYDYYINAKITHEKFITVKKSFYALIVLLISFMVIYFLSSIFT